MSFNDFMEHKFKFAIYLMKNSIPRLMFHKILNNQYFSLITIG